MLWLVLNPATESDAACTSRPQTHIVEAVVSAAKLYFLLLVALVYRYSCCPSLHYIDTCTYFDAEVGQTLTFITTTSSKSLSAERWFALHTPSSTGKGCNCV